MSNQLQVHTDNKPTFAFTTHKTFSVLEMVCVGDKGETTTIKVFLPLEITKGDFVKAAVEATEHKGMGVK